MRKKDTGTFIKEAIKIHKNAFIYDKVLYLGSLIEVIITCKKHGDFLQLPKTHLRGQNGCALCTGKKEYTQEQAIILFKETHKSLYDYSLVKYINANTPVIILCKKHGEFLQKPINHWFGHKCHACTNSITIDKCMFIKRAKEKHDNKYDYTNPQLYNPENTNHINGKLFKDLYNNTLIRESELISANYKLITIWENDFRCLLKKNF